MGFPLRGLLFLVEEPALRGTSSVVVAHGLNSCGSRALELNGCGTVDLVAPRHVGAFWIREQIHVFCVGRMILHHLAPGRPQLSFYWYKQGISFSTTSVLTYLYLYI